MLAKKQRVGQRNYTRSVKIINIVFNHNGSAWRTWCGYYWLLYSTFSMWVSRHQDEGSTVVIPPMSPQHFDFLVATCSKSITPADCPATSSLAFFKRKNGWEKYRNDYVATHRTPNILRKPRDLEKFPTLFRILWLLCLRQVFCPSTRRGEAPRKIAGRPLSPVFRLPIFHSAPWKGWSLGKVLLTETMNWL